MQIGINLSARCNASPLKDHFIAVFCLRQPTEQRFTNVTAIAGNLVTDNGAHGVDVRLDNLHGIVIEAAVLSGGLVEALGKRRDQRLAKRATLAAQLMGKNIDLSHQPGTYRGILPSAPAKASEITQIAPRPLGEVQCIALQLFFRVV